MSIARVIEIDETAAPGAEMPGRSVFSTPIRPPRRPLLSHGRRSVSRRPGVLETQHRLRTQRPAASAPQPARLPSLASSEAESHVASPYRRLLRQPAPSLADANAGRSHRQRGGARPPRGSCGSSISSMPAPPSQVRSTERRCRCRRAHRRRYRDRRRADRGIARPQWLLHGSIQARLRPRRARSACGQTRRTRRRGGGPRHALVVEYALRPLFGFFTALTVPTAVYASDAEIERISEGNAYCIADPGLKERIAATARELSDILQPFRGAVGGQLTAAALWSPDR